MNLDGNRIGGGMKELSKGNWKTIQVLSLGNNGIIEHRTSYVWAKFIRFGFVICQRYNIFMLVIIGLVRSE